MNAIAPNRKDTKAEAIEASDHAFRELCSQLAELQNGYAGELQAEGLRMEILCLTEWLRDYTSAGSREAEENLRNHGTSLLQIVHARLMESAQDMERMKMQNPATANPTGSGLKADAFSKAAQLAKCALEHLHETFGINRTFSQQQRS